MLFCICCVFFLLSLLVGPSVCPSVLAPLSMFSSWISFIPQCSFFTLAHVPHPAFIPSPQQSSLLYIFFFFLFPVPSLSAQDYWIFVLFHHVVLFIAVCSCTVVFFYQFYYPAGKAQYSVLCWLIPKYGSLFNYYLALPLVSDTRFYLSVIWVILLCIHVLLKQWMQKKRIHFTKYVNMVLNVHRSREAY